MQPLLSDDLAGVKYPIPRKMMETAIMSNKTNLFSTIVYFIKQKLLFVNPV
jgi:hypothetical protein